MDMDRIRFFIDGFLERMVLMPERCRSWIIVHPSARDQQVGGENFAAGRGLALRPSRVHAPYPACPGNGFQPPGSPRLPPIDQDQASWTWRADPSHARRSETCKQVAGFPGIHFRPCPSPGNGSTPGGARKARRPRLGSPHPASTGCAVQPDGVATGACAGPGAPEAGSNSHGPVAASARRRISDSRARSLFPPETTQTT